MKQEIYDSLAAQIADGKVVYHNGRSASTLADLEFIQFAEDQENVVDETVQTPVTQTVAKRAKPFKFPEGGVVTDAQIPAQLDGQPVTGIVPGAETTTDAVAIAEGDGAENSTQGEAGENSQG